MSLQTRLAEAEAVNSSLKATLSSLKASGGPVSDAVPESAAKAATAMRIIALQEKEFELKQKLEQQELANKQILQTIKEDKMALKKITTEIEKEKSSGKDKKSREESTGKESLKKPKQKSVGKSSEKKSVGKSSDQKSPRAASVDLTNVKDK